MDQVAGSTGGNETCLTEGCGRPPRSKTKPGYCAPCQSRASYHRKNPGAPSREIGYHGKWLGVECSVVDCSGQAAAKGLCRACYQKQNPYKKDPASARAHRIKHRYGITVAQYEEMVFERDNRCDVCGCKPSKTNTRAHWVGKLCIDHCHDTGRVRGLLCNDCNLAVGYGKTPEGLRSAANYLEFHNRRDS
jgi:hypothetical protein